MGNLFKLSFLAFMMMLFVGCGDDEPAPEPEPEPTTVEFNGAPMVKALTPYALRLEAKFTSSDMNDVKEVGFYVAGQTVVGKIENNTISAIINYLEADSSYPVVAYVVTSIPRKQTHRSVETTGKTASVENFFDPPVISDISHVNHYPSNGYLANELTFKATFMYDDPHGLFKISNPYPVKFWWSVNKNNPYKSSYSDNCTITKEGTISMAEFNLDWMSLKEGEVVYYMVSLDTELGRVFSKVDSFVVPKVVDQQ